MAMSKNSLRNFHRGQVGLTIFVAVVSWALFQSGLVDAASALTLFFAIEIPMAVLLGCITIARFRSSRQEAPKSLIGKLDAVAAEEPLLRYPVSEVKLLVSLVKVIRRRTPHPSTFGYVKGTLTVPVAFVVASLIEIVVVHLLVPWQWLRLLLLAGTLYGIVLLLGVFAARVDNPHRVSVDLVELNWGLNRVLEIPVDAIEHVAAVAEHSKASAGIEGETLVLAFMNSANVRIDLAVPYQVANSCRIPVSGSSRSNAAKSAEGTLVRTVFLSVDEPRRFVEEVRSTVDEKDLTCK